MATKARTIKQPVVQLCSRCKKRPARSGRKSCEACIQQEGQYQQTRYTKRREAGLCIKCGRVPATAGVCCDTCVVRQRDAANKHAEARRIAGICACGAPVVTGSRRCQACREQHNVRALQSGKRLAASRSLAGLCSRCGSKPETGMKLCLVCREHYRSKYARKRLRVITHYGGRCTCCGESTPEFLHLDHVNNDGGEHRKQVGRTIYSWVIRHNFPTDFQILCANCNLAKGFYGQCPHQRT